MSKIHDEMIAESRKKRDECPNRANHTEGPKGYLNWGEWARVMNKTHRQTKCPGCGYFIIWTSRKKDTCP